MLTVNKLQAEYAARSIGDFVTNIQELATGGFLPVSVEKLAQHRIEYGSSHEISWTGTRTSDLFISKNGEYFLAHANIENFHSDPEDIQSYHEEKEEIPYEEGYVTDIIRLDGERDVIPVEDFAHNPVAKFLFGEQVEAYAQWLKEAKIPALPIHLPNFSLTSYTYDFVRPVIIRCTDNWSGIITTNADLYDHYAYRGYSPTYAGQIEKDEVFTSEQLEVLRKFAPVEDREYSLKELETLMERTPYSSLLGAMLRFIRNGGDSNMPANYSIFTD